MDRTRRTLAATFLAFASLLATPAALAVGTVTASPLVVQFPATAVGSTSSGVVETVTLTGYSGPFTFTQHYAKDYYFSGPTCTGTNPTTCTLTVYFRPTLPGVRKEAVFVFNNGTRIGSILFSGVGAAPLAALQPGVITSPAGLQISTSGYLETPVTDENGAVYFYNTAANSIQSCAPGCGSPTTLVSNVGGIFNLSIDGAGILYWGLGGNTATAVTAINTYDTVQNIQGTVTLPASDLYYSLTVDGMGDLFAIGNNSQNIYKILPNGTSTTTAVNPSSNQDYYSITDSLGDLFVSGYTVNELTIGGSQTQILNPGSSSPLGVDAAGTLYTVRNPPGELAPSNYSVTSYSFTPPGFPGGESVAVQSSGTLYYGTLGGAYQVNRSQDTIAFGSQTAGTASATQTVNMLNIGNMPLVLSNIALTGTGYTLQTAATNPCTAGISLAAGASCNIAVNFSAPNAGNYPGSIVVTSNSLNNTSSNQTITLTAFINGAYLTVSPSNLAFNPQTIATSTAKTVTVTNSGYGGSATLSTPASTNPAFTVAPAATSGCGSTLAVGATCQLTVTFTPTLPQNYSGTISMTGNEGGGTPVSSISVPATGQGLPSVTQSNPLVFNPAPVAESLSSAQTLTASFTIAGYTTVVTPTASMHYGTSFSVGTVSCTGSAGNQTCTVPVTFLPIYPGGRRDAVFMTVGGVRAATLLVYGIGQAPFALVQPGIVTNPISSGGYYYTGIVDENGTAYMLGDNTNTCYSITKTGVVTLLPIAGLNSPRQIGVDGAGVLYIADQTPLGHIITYDTVQGIQSTAPFASAEFYNQGVAVGNTGNIYLTDGTSIYTEPIVGTGTAKTTAISPADTQGFALTVDSAENVFLSGYTINELTPGGVQTQVNGTSSNGNEPLSVDAAGTLYSGRYGTGGVGMLAASNYGVEETSVDGNAGVLGVAVGPDGTVYAGDYNYVDKVDRSQGSLAFGEQYGTTPATQTAIIYNGGNTPLTISNIALSSNGGFTMGTASSNNCTVGTPIAPGALCNIAISFLSPHAGTFSGNLAITSNTLNTTATQNVALSAFTYGVYVSVSPNPLSFSNQTVGTTSAPQTITFTNNGDLYSASIGSPTYSGSGYTVTLGSCSNVVVGGNCTGTVTFSPTAAQSYNGVVATFQASSSGGGANQVFTLTLNGTGTPAPAPAVTFLPTSVAFASQTVGTTSPVSVVQVTNSGNAALTISGVTLTGTNPGVFALVTSTTNPCGTTLAAGASCNISVTFKPTSATSFSASISVSDNATGSPQTVPLTGTGTPLSVAQLQFVPAQLSVIAGTGKGAANDTGDGGPALAATFNAPFGVAQDGSGTIYVADQDDNYVRKFTVGGNIYAFAGLPTDGGGAYSGDSGQATNAYLSQPIGLAVDASGNIYIGDFGNARVRKVVPSTGVITTYIGNGSGYYNGSTGPSTPIPGPAGLCFDPSGNLYIASTNASLIIKVTPSLVPSVFAGNFNGLPNGVAGYNGDNIAANTAEINFPNNVACDQAGNVYIADTNNNRIRKVAAGTGIITTVAGNGTGGYTGDGGPATSAEIYAWGVATDLAGDLFITSTPAGTSGATVRKVDTSGNITTVAGGGTGGSGGPATAMMFGGLGLTGVDNNGSLLIPSYDYGNQTDAVYSAGPSGFLQFGTVSVGTTSAPQTVTFENTGNAPLTLSQTTYTATGNFTVTGGTCAGLTTLASGATCTLTVTFTPPSATTYTGTIAVNSNGTLPAQTINLVGTGAAVATLALTPATVPFPSQTINTSSTPYGMLLQNTSSVPVTIAGITFGGANPSNFTQTNNCPTSLVAYASCTISVTFTPTAVQTYSATISVASSASNSPQTSTLTGTGTAVPLPAAVFNPTSLAFGNQAVGTTSNQMSFILSNPTSVTLNISSVTITGANPGAFSIFNNACGATLGPSSCTVIVTFTPPAVGAFSANVTFTDNATGSPQNVPLTGTGVGPQAVLTPTSLTFPSTTVGATSAAQTIQLSNPGGAPLILSGITVTGANANSFAQTNNCPLSLAAAATCTISVTFTPATATAGLTAAISVADNATGSPQTATLTGTGTPVSTPQAVLTPTSLAFANTPVGTTSAAQTITLSNPGTATLTISGISVTGTNPSSFAQTNNCGSALPAGTTCTISVTFTPASATALSATISVADNAGATLPSFSSGSSARVTSPRDSSGTQTVALTGTGTAPQVSLSPASLTFSATSGTTSAAQTITLSNPGNGTLTISGISITGANPSDFAETTTCGATLAAAATCTISVTFTPASVASFTASVSVADNVTGSPQTVTLSGTGTAAPTPQAVLTPSVLTFPSTTVNVTSAAQTITLSNPGNATLNISGISIAGANPADFAESTTCGATLAASATCTISVTFTPLSVATFTAAIAVADNATGSPQTATVSGTGTAVPTPQALLAPSTLTFPSTTVNVTSAAQTITLSNPGNATLNITGISIAGANPADFAETTTCGATLAASATCTISVTFTPLSAATFGATISVADNATGSPQTASLSGTGTAAPVPQAVLTPNSLTFPATAVGTTSAALTTVLSNPGNATLNISGISITGANASAFAETSTCGTTLAASATCTISVTFTPTSATAFAAAISVADNATGSPQTAALSGSGTAPQAVLTPATLTFPSTTVGVTSAALTTTLSNPGNATLNITGISLAGANPTDFAETTTCGATLAAAATCTISVTFKPLSAASFAATISVADNATGSPQTAALSGTGTAPLVPQAVLTPTSLTFTSQTVNSTSAAQTITLSNPGNGPLTITGVSIAGTNPTDFAETTTCGTSLAAAATCTISVTFTPLSAASFSATVSVGDNATGSPQTATLAGTGIAAAIDYTVTTTTPTVSVQPGTPALFTIDAAALGGSYNNPVTLSASGLPSGATYTFTPPVITPGLSGATSTLSILTPSLLALADHPHGKLPPPWLAAVLLLPWFGVRRVRRRLARARLLTLLLGLASLGALAGCAGGYFGPGPQSYTITVTGTSGTIQHSTTVTLTVQ